MRCNIEQPETSSKDSLRLSILLAPLHILFYPTILSLLPLSATAMAPIDSPKQKPDFIRPQTQDGLPWVFEPGHTIIEGPQSQSYPITSPAMEGPKFQDNRTPPNMPPQLKRAEEIVDPALPDVANALDQVSGGAEDKPPVSPIVGGGPIGPVIVPLPIIHGDPPIGPIVPIIGPGPLSGHHNPEDIMPHVGHGPGSNVPKLKRDVEIVDPELPDVADALDKDVSDFAAENKAQDTKGGRIMRECTHGGAHCKPRMRGHGGHKTQPKEVSTASVIDLLERRDQSEAVLTQGSWEAACQNPTFEHAKFCQGIVVQPRAGGGSAGAGIAAAAAMGAAAASAGHSAQENSLDILQDESSSYHWLLVTLVIIMCICIVGGVLYHAVKKFKRKNAQGARTVPYGAANAEAIELQSMDWVVHQHGGSKC